VVERFGYLQLDTVSIAGARSHALVLLSRLQGLSPALAEELLEPGCPYFEYWGHEASWMPLELYPAFAFRRRAYRHHRWHGRALDESPRLADELLARTREEGPFRSADLEGSGRGSWWGFKKSKRVATSLWSCGELAIRQRRNFQRTFDLTERVIPAAQRRDMPLEEALPVLLLRALCGHGWASTGTLAATWRLANLRPEITRALESLEDRGEIVACDLEAAARRIPGWIRPADLELVQRLDRARPNAAQGVLLSPFDPVLWDRARVLELFGFEQVLEIYKPPAQRVYGYFCLPVLAGERLVARVDLKADRRAGRLDVLSTHYEDERPDASVREAVRCALERHSEAVELAV
jgi:uncharacterized protein YcaQ